MRRVLTAFRGLIALLLLGSVLLPTTASAQTPGVTMATTFPNVIGERGKPVTLPIQIKNPGSAPQTVNLSVNAPEGWKATLKSGGFLVRSFHVAPDSSLTEKDRERLPELSLEITPAADAAARDYPVTLKGDYAGGSAEVRVTIGIQDQAAGGLKLTTQFPELRGPITNQFEFKVDLVNNTTAEQSIALTSGGPQDWQVTFKPKFETKQISNLRVKAGETQGLDVTIAPPRNAKAGDYEIPISAAAGSDNVRVPLKIALVGEPKLALNTPDGRLNTTATAGATQNVNFLVANTGTGPLTNVSLSANRTPNDWKVTFNPEKIDSIAPNEIKQVSATIQPDGKTLAGDYSLGVTASSGGASESKDIRVSVETSTAWGWAGIGIVGVVVVGLFGMFRTFGRR